MEWAVVFATLVGPILAVQAQKWIERGREARNRKEWVFHILMANRAQRLSTDFVRGLNTIDKAFKGGIAKKTLTEQRVIDVWRDYLNVLTHGLGQNPTTEEERQWAIKVDDLAVDLYSAIAKDLGYSFDRETLRSGGYSTRADAIRDRDLIFIRQALVGVINGNRSIPVSIVSQVGAPESREP